MSADLPMPADGSARALSAKALARANVARRSGEHAEASFASLMRGLRQDKAAASVDPQAPQPAATARLPQHPVGRPTDANRWPATQAETAAPDTDEDRPERQAEPRTDGDIVDPDVAMFVGATLPLSIDAAPTHASPSHEPAKNEAFAVDAPTPDAVSLRQHHAARLADPEKPIMLAPSAVSAVGDAAAEGPSTPFPLRPNEAPQQQSAAREVSAKTVSAEIEPGIRASSGAGAMLSEALPGTPVAPRASFPETTASIARSERHLAPRDPRPVASLSAVSQTEALTTLVRGEAIAPHRASAWGAATIATSPPPRVIDATASGAEGRADDASRDQSGRPTATPPEPVKARATPAFEPIAPTAKSDAAPATAVAASQPMLTPLQQVAQAIAATASDGPTGPAAPAPATRVQETPRLLQIALDPAELGGVLLQIRSVGGGLDIVVAPERAETAAALQRDRHRLQALIEAVGVKVESVVIRHPDPLLSVAAQPDAALSQSTSHAAQSFADSAGGSSERQSSRRAAQHDVPQRDERTSGEPRPDDGRRRAGGDLYV